MKRLTRLTTAFLFFSMLLTGCYYDKESELYPVAPDCDTAGVMTYSASIAPIMTANCNVCHSAAVAESGVVTENYDGLSVVAKNGALWAAVSWSGSIKMPEGNDKLSDCDLTKIKKWIDAGSPNN